MFWTSYFNDVNILSATKRHTGRQENNVLQIRTKLYMNSTIDDVASTNISRETNYFHYFVRYPKYNLYVLSMFLNFGYLISALRSYKIVLIKRVYLFAMSLIPVHVHFGFRFSSLHQCTRAG